MESQVGQAASGILGLDDILSGGFSRGSLFLIEGSPGTGKTTLALDYLLEGARRSESGLYVTLSETKYELLRGASSHGWSIDPRIEIFELQPPDSLLDPKQAQSLLYSSDLELGETVKMLFAAVDRAKPAHIVIDSLSEIRLLAQSSLRYRRQLLAMKHYFAQTGATVLALDDLTAEANDKTAHSIAHGVLRLEALTPNYGAERRRLRVMKYRGHVFRGGFHDFSIKTGGLEVYPRLISSEHRGSFDVGTVSSGNTELDALLGGGLEHGSSTLVLGPAGAGKSLLVLQFIAAACGRGEKAALFVFDEELGLLFRRAKGMSIDLDRLKANGNLIMEQIDAAELSPGEFAYRVRSAVEKSCARIVVIDSLNGYQHSMPEENSLILHMQELLQFLNRKGASTFLTVAQHGIVGNTKTPVDVTYLADSVILLRFFEASGRVRRAISVIKKRTGAHEDTIREFRITNRGLVLGEPSQRVQWRAAWSPDLPGSKRPALAGRSGLMPHGGITLERVLILAPHGRDAEIASALLMEGGWHTYICTDVTQLCLELQKGAAFALLTEEAIADSDLSKLSSWVKGQPPWSDMLIVLLTAHGESPGRVERAVRYQEILGNLTYLERPFHPTTLVGVARSAIRSRQRQYEARALLERHMLLARELQHRTKNLLAVIQSIASVSLSDGPARQAYFARLHALGRAQDLLLEGDGRGASIKDLVARTLDSFGQRVTTDGPPVHLSATTAQGFALILHELAANAAKHGALSVPTGKVTVHWLPEAGSPPALRFRWRERGGPPALPPKRKGFGTNLLKVAVPSVDRLPSFQYSTDGFEYELRAVLDVTDPLSASP